MEYLVIISKRRAFWSLNDDILKINDSDYQYAISIKEDTAYPCLHSPKTTKETSLIRRIQRRPIRRIEDLVNLDNSKNNVLIPLDSWTSGLLVYKLSLSNDNEMVEVKVLMALAKENDAVSKEDARNGEWVKISMRKCISEKIPSQKKRILGVGQLTKDSSSSGLKDLFFVKSSADNTKVTIPGVERPWLSKVEGFILPNHDTGKILPSESQRNTTDPSVVVTDSSANDYDSADESSFCSTPLPPLKKLDGVEPISGPKIIKSILRSKSLFKAEALKSVIINEPSSAPAKGNKSSSASKVHPAPAGKLKSVKIKDDPPLAIVMKELNNLKLQFSKNQSSHSRNDQSQHTPQNKYKTQFKKRCELCGLNNHLTKNCYKVLFCKKCERIDHKTYDHAEYICTMNMSQHLKSLGRMSSRPNIPRPSKRFFPPCIHYGGIDHLSNECLYYPICKLCGSYDHDTNGHNMIISLEREINLRNSQHAFKKCEACGSPNHTTTDHYDIEWFKRGKALQVKKVEALKSTRAESSNANRSKTPTKRNSTLVKFYDEKEISQNFSSPYTPKQNVYIHNHKDHLGKFDEKADDGYLLGYLLVSKAFRVFNTRRQQTKETYHITCNESPKAIKFSKPSVDNINIAELERYPPDEYLHLYEPSQRWSQDKHLELVNIIGNPGAGMLTRAIDKQLSAASDHECLFVDFLSKEEPKKFIKMDVKSAFLNGKLKEKVYVKQWKWIFKKRSKKKAKNKQIQAREGKDQVKSKSKVIRMKKIQLEGLKLPSLKLSYALSWKPCQGDSLNLPDHRIHKDGDGDALFQLKSNSLPHAHAQTTKTYYKHRDLRIMKAQELKTKTSAQTLIYKIFLQIYQVYQGRLLASFQDDAKYEHVGQDTRSQGTDNQEKDEKHKSQTTKLDSNGTSCEDKAKAKQKIRKSSNSTIYSPNRSRKFEDYYWLQSQPIDVRKAHSILMRL
ncbi:hypothetical protein Tco_1193371 [Tanacetum coccineum]